jgi:putative phage-type endonuclease
MVSLPNAAAAMQRTQAWFQARVGKVTASRIVDVMAELADKKKEAVTRRNYRRELALERFTNVPQDSGYQSWAMAQGIAKEDAARDAYAFAKGVDVELAGFVRHPTIEHAGASPDGFVGDRGLVELKSPEANAMWEMLTHHPLDRRYIYQAQWQLACSPSREWVDVAFYREGCPMSTENGTIVRLVRDSEHIKTLEDGVIQFLSEVEADYQMLCKAQRR